MRGVVEESDLKSVKLINVQPHFCDYVPFVGFEVIFSKVHEKANS